MLDKSNTKRNVLFCWQGRTTRGFLENRKRLQAAVVTFTPAFFAVTVHNQKPETFVPYKPLKGLPDFA